MKVRTRLVLSFSYVLLVVIVALTVPLGVVLRDRARSEDADDAYALLAYLYLRTGQYERFATLYQAWAARFPQSAAVRNERENFEKYRGRPNQVNGERRPSMVRHDEDGYLTLPISIDGRTDDFIFDTGAFQSAVTEREARKLGMTIQDDQRTLIDISGTPTAFRTAVAKEVRLGSMTFRNVSFAVITPGGVLNGLHQETIGVPRFSEGEQNVLFIRNDRVGPSVLYLDQGAYRVSEDGQVAPVPSDLVLIDSQTGRARSTADEGSRTLEDFERQVERVAARRRDR